MTRWDQPLFVVPSVPYRLPGEPEAAAPEPVPSEDIWRAITEGVAAKAPDVVAPQTATAGNYLTLLETSTQAVIGALLEHAHTLGLPEAGGTIRLPVPLAPGGAGPVGAAGKDREAVVEVHVPPLSRPLGLAALQRYRRSFVRMHATGLASINVLGDAAREEAQNEAVAQREIARRFAAWLGEVLPSM